MADTDGEILMRTIAALTVATLALAGCTDPEPEDADDQEPAAQAELEADDQAAHEEVEVEEPASSTDEPDPPDLEEPIGDGLSPDVVDGFAASICDTYGALVDGGESPAGAFIELWETTTQTLEETGWEPPPDSAIRDPEILSLQLLETGMREQCIGYWIDVERELRDSS